MNKHHNQSGTQLFLRSSLIFSLVIGVGWLTFFFSQQLTGSAVAQPQPALSNNNDIITDTVWTAVNSPYVITSPVTIMPGAVLTVEAGVTVVDAVIDFPLLTVEEEAHLVVQGTAEFPVTFTSEANSGPADWAGLVIRDGGSAQVDHALFQNSLFNIIIYGENGGPVIIANTVFSQSVYGLDVAVNALHRLQMTDVAFVDVVNSRVLIDIIDYYGPLNNNATLTAHPGLEGYVWGPNPGLEVPAGITLTLEPGVTMLAPENGLLAVAGHLLASGTLTHPVTFTSILTGTAGWGGLQLQGSAYLSHTQVSQAQAGGILVDGGQLTAVCSTFSHNQTAGIWVTDNGMPQVTVTASNLYGNGVAGLQNDHSSPVEAGQNWWGDASGPGGIGPGSGDAVWGEVVYDPWLTETAVCPLSDDDDEPISGLTAVNSSPTPLNQTTYFTATISAGSNVSYTWDFGDGNHGDGPVVNHSYEAAGVYTATVTAGNSAGSVQAATVVTVSAEAPQPELLIELRVSPPLAQPGETITYTLVLTNSGEVTLHELSSTAGVGSGFVLPHSLTPGVSWSAVYTYAVLAGDLPGPLVNTVSVTAVPPDHEPLTVTTAVSVTLQPGDFLLYLPLVRNNGGAAVGER